MTAPPSPGLLLGKKRIENGWAVPDVARVLCLSRGQMEALESDDYANLPGETYVLGYWRSYARLLGIAIGESVAFHKKNLRDTASGLLPDPESRRRWRGLEPQHQHLELAFALLSVVFLLGIWYWQHPPSISLLEQPDWRVEDGYAQNDADSEVAGAAAWGGEPGGQDEDDHSILPESMIALPEPNFSEENDPQRPDPGSAPHAERVAGAENDEVAKTTANRPEFVQADDREAGKFRFRDGAFQGVVAGLGQQLSRQPSHQPAGLLVQPQTTIPPDTLVFAVDRESWVEVHDNAGKRLIYRTVARGQRVVLQGQPPFSVFVGNAEGVAVRYRGRPVPFTARGGGLFARFTVGAQ